MKKVLLFITFLLFSKLCFAASFEAPKIEEGEPLEIRAEKTDVYRRKGEIHFMNNVKAVQGEMTILSKKMIIKYTEDKDSNISIDEILVKGGANLFTETIKASGNSGVYDFRKGNVSLKGNVVAKENDATAFGEEFIYNVNTRKTKLLGNKKKDDRVIIILDNVDELINDKENKETDDKKTE